MLATYGYSRPRAERVFIVHRIQSCRIATRSVDAPNIFSIVES
jgi:hypothetical protein